MIVQFLDAFNDIQVKRLEPDSSTVRELIRVPVKLAVKEKFWYWLQERKDDEVLPMITAWLSTIDYASDRQVNTFYELCTSTDPETGTYEKFPHPTPYNFTFAMNIWSLYLSDIDQILEQILPFFAPHIFIRIRIDELEIEYDIKVIFQSCTPEVSLEMSDDQYRVINYSLEFVAQAWLFKPAVTEGGLVKCIYTNYSTTADALDRSLTDTTSTFTSGASGEATSLCGYYDEDGQLIIDYETFSSGESSGNACQGVV
jgi:hypothetical protein